MAKTSLGVSFRVVKEYSCAGIFNNLVFGGLEIFLTNLAPAMLNDEEH